MAESGHTHKHTNTLLCVSALASADLQLLPAACPVAVTVSWERVSEWLCGCLRPRLLTPVTPIPPHAACVPPSFPPSRARCKHGIQFVTYRARSGPRWPLHFLSVGPLAVACFSVLWKRRGDQTVASDSKKFTGRGLGWSPEDVLKLSSPE